MYRVLDHLVNYAHQTAWQSVKKCQHNDMILYFMFLCVYTFVLLISIISDTHQIKTMICLPSLITQTDL